MLLVTPAVGQSGGLEGRMVFLESHWLSLAAAAVALLVVFLSLGAKPDRRILCIAFGASLDVVLLAADWVPVAWTWLCLLAAVPFGLVINHAIYLAIMKGPSKFAIQGPKKSLGGLMKAAV